MKKSLEDLNKIYGFAYTEVVARGEKLHPIYLKHLKATWEIEAVYDLVHAEQISTGKARELTAAIIETFSDQSDLHKIAKEKGMVCWLIPTSYSGENARITWGYEIEILQSSIAYGDEHFIYSYEQWDTYDEAKEKMIAKANKLFDERRLAAPPK